MAKIIKAADLFCGAGGSLDEPLNTVTTCTGETALVQPFLNTCH